jgi:hypothetical protein
MKLKQLSQIVLLSSAAICCLQASEIIYHAHVVYDPDYIPEPTTQMINSVGAMTFVGDGSVQLKIETLTGYGLGDAVGVWFRRPVDALGQPVDLYLDMGFQVTPVSYLELIPPEWESSQWEQFWSFEQQMPAELAHLLGSSSVTDYIGFRHLGYGEEGVALHGVSVEFTFWTHALAAPYPGLTVLEYPNNFTYGLVEDRDFDIFFEWQDPWGRPGEATSGTWFVESEGGVNIYVPEPATVGFIAVGILSVIVTGRSMLRKRRRASGGNS